MVSQVRNVSSYAQAVYVIRGTRLEQPIDLAPHGAPGCLLYAVPESVELLGDGSTSILNDPLLIPGDPRFLGTKSVQQALIFDSQPSAAPGAGGFYTTNALEFTIGVQ